MRAWLRHHGQSLAQTLARLASAPFATALNILAIGVALALPLGAYVLLANLQSLARGLSVEPQVSVFLAPGAGALDAKELERRLRAEAGVSNVRFVPKETALADLKRSARLGEVVAALRENPLPDAFVVTLARNDAALLERLLASARALPKVAHAQADSDWVRRLDALLALGRTAITVLGLLLSFGLVAVIFNTIRLQILTQLEEIEVSKLIGATDAYIRRPFFYLGTLLGLSGGIAALGIVAGALVWLDRDVSALVALYGGAFELHFLPWRDSFSLLAFAAALGWLGAFLSVSKHLREFQPR